MASPGPPARSEHPRPASLRRSAGEARILLVAILASFVAFLDACVVNVALPAIDRDLGGGLAVQQWVVGGYLLPLGSLILVAGAVSDVFGRIRILRLGLMVFGTASLACAAAPGATGLVAARIVQGAGAALLVPASLALITMTLPAGSSTGRSASGPLGPLGPARPTSSARFSADCWLTQLAGGWSLP